MSRSEANPLDVESIDAIISAAYDSISGPPGKRDWNRERSLFIPGARLIPMAENAGETIVLAGDSCRHIYVIKSGTVEVTSPPTPDGQQAVKRLGAGDHFGELALVGPTTDVVTVRAVTAATKSVAQPWRTNLSTTWRVSAMYQNETAVYQ